MAIILDGKKVAAEIQEGVRAQVALLKARGVTPRLTVLLVGDNPASRIYVRNKARSCEAVGMASEVIQLPESATHQELIAHVDALNADPSVDGERSSRLPAARPDGHDRHAVTGGDGEDAPHLLGRLDLHRRPGLEHAQVRLVLAVLGEPLPVEDDPVLREGGAQVPDRAGHPRLHPKIPTSLPFIASGASAAHQPTTRATSSGPMAGGNGVCASIRVSTPPGETVITWTPEPRSSSARLFAKPMSPHFEAL